MLSHADLEEVIHVFFTMSHLNYCNFLYLGLSQKVISCLQLIQNAAARLKFSEARPLHPIFTLVTCKAQFRPKIHDEMKLLSCKENLQCCELACLS